MKKNIGVLFLAGVIVYSLIPLVSFAEVTNLNEPNAGQGSLSANDMKIVQADENGRAFGWFDIPWHVDQGGTGATSFTNGSVPFISNNIFSQNNSQFSWDNANNALSIGGTTSPLAKINIKGSSSMGLLNIVSSTGTSLLYVNSVGNVGIGNSNPQHALDISGAMYSRLVTLPDSPSVVLSWNAGNVQTLTLNTGSSAITFNNGKPGAEYKLILKQDAAGGRSVSWPASVKWTGGAAPTLTSTPGATDVMSFVYDGTNYLGSYTLGYGVPTAVVAPPTSSIAFDNAAYGGETGGTPASASFSYTTGTLTNGLMIVGVNSTCSDQTNVTQPTATYNGTSMTLYGSIYGDTNTGKLWMFYLVNPTSGTHTVTVTQGPTAATCLDIMVTTYKGVDQANPIEASAINSGLVSNISVTGTSLTSTDWGVFGVVAGGNVTASTNVTARVHNGNTPFMGDSNGPVGTSSFSMTVNTSAGDVNAMGLFIKAAP